MSFSEYQKQQQEIKKIQDEKLDKISAQLGNLDDLTKIMTAEINDQGVILGDVERAVDQTTVKVEGTTGRIERFRKSIKSRDLCIIVILVFILVIVLIVMLS